MGQGRNNVKGYLREHPEIAAEIERKIYEALGVEPAGAPLAAVPAIDAPEGEAPPVPEAETPETPETPEQPEERAA
jgi:recombination protein RecA